ncbi:gluconokinase [Variovorax boronicumulans]|uniref:gluconokinase n=1 Tax=Variovorax boronicumulans TaxID=436515 RepID=UPI003398F1F8
MPGQQEQTQQTQQGQRRLAVVVMGVSGCGKSSVAAGLADRLGVPWIDGDDLHAPEAVVRMRGGQPLTDEDRWPWLARIGACLADPHAAPRGVVVACSALKRAYRDRLRMAAPGLSFVFLDGADALIQRRLQERRGHYMPPALLQSQLRTLEKPGAGEPDVLHIDIDQPIASIVAGIAARLLDGTTNPSPQKVSA